MSAFLIVVPWPLLWATTANIMLLAFTARSARRRWVNTRPLR
ncbi:MAG: hypothetical protein P4M15_10300 [Alphaproteobacteria bacterium]|nr:hypothetical protein [Alphaproteobacteria bacterium]